MTNNYLEGLVKDAAKAGIEVSINDFPIKNLSEESAFSKIIKIDYKHYELRKKRAAIADVYFSTVDKLWFNVNLTKISKTLPLNFDWKIIEDKYDLMPTFKASFQYKECTLVAIGDLVCPHQRKDEGISIVGKNIIGPAFQKSLDSVYLFPATKFEIVEPYLRLVVECPNKQYKMSFLKEARNYVVAPIEAILAKK